MGERESALEGLARLMNFSEFQGKRILVTGHTGFKGSWLSEWLLELGAHVSGFSSEIPTQPAHFEVLELSPRLRHDLRGNINNIDSVMQAFDHVKPEVVFHLAAQPLVRLSYDDPLTTFATNIMGTAHMMEAIRQHPGVQAFVNVTSDKCYENKELGIAFRESDAMGGSDPYSASKGGAELIFQSYFRSFFKTGPTKMATVRAGNVIGGGDWAQDRLVVDCMKAWSNGEPVTLRNPASVRPWQHVLEPVGGYLVVAAHLLSDPEGVHGEGFNFGPTEESQKTAKELVEMMQRYWPGSKTNMLVNSDEFKHEAKFLKLNCEKAAAVLNWRPRLNFQNSVEWTLRWYRAFYEKTGRATDITKEQIISYSELLKEVCC